jgi:YVTN family beta-propeller protein
MTKSASTIVSQAMHFSLACAVFSAFMFEVGPQTASASGGSLKLVATVEVGVFPGDAAVTPDGKYLYVTNYGSATVSVIDTSLNTVSTTITSILGPGNIVITKDGTTAFVLADSGIFVISTATNQIIRTIPTPTSSSTVLVSTPPSFYTDIAVTSDGTQLYASNFDGTTSIINVASCQVEKTLTVGYNANVVASSPDGESAYVIANAAGGPFFLTKIDVASQTIVAPQLAQFKHGMSGYLAFSPNSRTLYFPVFLQDIWALNTVTGRREQEFVLSNQVAGNELGGVAVSPNGTFLYVALTEANKVATVNTQTGAQLGTIVVGSNPTSVAIFGGRLYVVNTTNGNPNINGTVSVLSR